MTFGRDFELGTSRYQRPATLSNSVRLALLLVMVLAIVIGMLLAYLIF